MYGGRQLIFAFFAFWGIFLVTFLRFQITYIVQAIVEEGTLDVTKTNETLKTQILAINPEESDASLWSYSEPNPNYNSKFSGVDNTMESLLVGIYFYGYIVLQLPLAAIGKEIGSFWVFGTIMIIPGFVNIIMALFPSINVLLAGRFIIGLVQGGAYPLLMGIWRSVAPVEQIAGLLSIEYAGGGVGEFSAPLLCSLLGKWKLILFVTGCLNIIYSLAWFWYFNKLDKEKKKNQTDIKPTPKLGELLHNCLYKIPWWRIITSVPVWGLIIAQIAANYGRYTIELLCIKFLSQYLGKDIGHSGLLATAPQILKPLICVFIGILADKLIKKDESGNDNRLKIRRILSAILFGGTALAYFSLVQFKDSLVYVITLWTLIFGFEGFGPAAFKANHIEIAPSLAGITFSLANAFGNLPGFVSPAIAAMLLNASPDNPATTDINESGHGWNMVFIETGIVAIVGMLAFQFMSSVDQQPWDNFVDEKKSSDDEEEKVELKADQAKESVEA